MTRRGAAQSPHEAVSRPATGSNGPRSSVGAPGPLRPRPAAIARRRDPSGSEPFRAGRRARPWTCAERGGQRDRRAQERAERRADRFRQTVLEDLRDRFASGALDEVRRTLDQHESAGAGVLGGHTQDLGADGRDQCARAIVGGDGVAQRTEPARRDGDRHAGDRHGSEPRPARGDLPRQAADGENDARDREVGVAAVRRYQPDEGEGREEERDPGEARECRAAGAPAIHRDHERGDDGGRPDPPDPPRRRRRARSEDGESGPAPPRDRGRARAVRRRTARAAPHSPRPASRGRPGASTDRAPPPRRRERESARVQRVLAPLAGSPRVPIGPGSSSVVTSSTTGTTTAAS